MKTIQIRVVDAGLALEWYKKSWSLLLKEPALFSLQFIMFYLLQIGVLALGPLSSFASNILWCILAAGFFYTCEKIDKGEPVKFSDFFKGFEKNTRPLIILGFYLTGILLLYSIFAIAMVVLIGGLSVVSYLNNLQELMDYFMANLLIGIFVLSLAVFVPMAVLMMASLFSPALVFFHDLKPVDAMKKSLHACAHNPMVFLLHGVWFVLFAIIAVIPFGMGLIILIPVVHLTIYYAYRDLFQLDTPKPQVTDLNSV
jgi:uncharacterized membrane protein